MQLHWLDLLIIMAYLVMTLLLGFYLSKRASKDLASYFLGGNTMKWYMLWTFQCLWHVGHQWYHVDRHDLVCVRAQKCLDSLALACMEPGFCFRISCCLDAQEQCL